MDFLTAKHVFIDTNVLLSFYHYSGDDLEELKKLIVLLTQNKVKLYLPSQVLIEFRRNREAKIADALKHLREQRLNLQFPQICKDYREYEKLRSLQKTYQMNHAALLNRLSEDVDKFQLKADVITSQLFTLSSKIECSDEIVNNARSRFAAIVDDDDVSEFLESIVKSHGSIIDNDNLHVLTELLHPSPDEQSDVEPPF